MDDPNLAHAGLPNKSNAPRHNDSTTKLLLGVAALALGQALQAGNGFLTLPALIWLTIALVCAGAGMVSPRLCFPPVSHRLLKAILVTGLFGQVLQLLTSSPGFYILPAYHPSLWQYQASVAFGGCCALLSLAPTAWFPLRIRSGLVVSAFLAVLVAGIWVIRASPDPFIDSYVFQQSSSEALLHGHNPYELTAPDIYGHMSYYGAELVKNDKLTIGNPYPPLSIYLSSLGYAVAGDIRYSHLVAILAAGVLMACLYPGQEALLAAYIFLFTPRVFFVLEQSWTEPMVLFLSVAVVWCAIHRPALRFIAAGLLVASKQYMIFLFPLMILLIPPASPRRVWVRAWSWAVGVAIAITVPLAFWNFPAFLWNVGLAQWYQVFRLDALSYAALYARISGQLPSQFLPFIALGAAFVVIWCYGRHSPGGFAAALALGLGLFLAFNKQAFCNYYFLVTGVLCCALAAIPTSDNLIHRSDDR